MKRKNTSACAILNIFHRRSREPLFWRRSNNHPNPWTRTLNRRINRVIIIIIIIITRRVFASYGEKMHVVVRGSVYKIVYVWVCSQCVWCWRTKTWPVHDDDDDNGLRAGRSAALRRLPRGPGVRATTSAAHVTHVYARARSRLYRYIHKLSLGNPSLRCCYVHLLFHLILLDVPRATRILLFVTTRQETCGHITTI